MDIPAPLNRRHLLLGSIASAVASPTLAQRAYMPGARSGAQIIVRSPQSAPTQPMQLWTGAIGGTFLKIGSDISVVASESGLRVTPVVSRGSIDNLRALIGVRGVDLALAAADSLAYMSQDPARQAQLANVRYIAKLYDSEFHLLARDPAIRTVADIAGKQVCTDTEGSGTSITAEVVFGALGVHANIVTDTPGRGLALLRRGEIDALAYVIGKPGVMFRSSPMTGLHLVEIPLSEGMAMRYVPTTFVPADYPELLPDGHPVDSIAVGTVLACYNWPVGTDRYRNLERFVRLFVARFADLQEPPYHSKWREVSLTSQAIGWQRFAPVDGILQEAQSEKDAAFNAFLASVGRSDAAGTALENLRADFERLRGR